MKQYPQLVAKAEEAVSGIKDTELKRVAFEKVLDDLLSEGAEPSPRPASKHESSRDRKRGAGSKRTPKAGGPKAYITELVNEEKAASTERDQGGKKAFGSSTW